MIVLSVYSEKNNYCTTVLCLLYITVSVYFVYVYEMKRK